MSDTKIQIKPENTTTVLDPISLANANQKPNFQPRVVEQSAPVPQRRGCNCGRRRTVQL